MWGKRSIGVLTAAVVASSAAACAHPNALAGDNGVPAAPIGVHVQNQNFNDLRIYAVSGGMARRIGTVTGIDTATFSLDPSYATRELYIVAVPIGGFGRASSGAVNVMAGDTLDFIVGPQLTANGVFIR